MGSNGQNITYDRLMAQPLEEWLVEQQTLLIREIMAPDAFVQDVPMLKLKLHSVQQMLRQATINIAYFESRRLTTETGELYIIDLQEAVDEAAEIAKEEAAKKLAEAQEEMRVLASRHQRRQQEKRRDELVTVLADGARELHYLMNEMGEDSYNLVRVVVGEKEKD
jgi:prephenate dehydratase